MAATTADERWAAQLRKFSPSPSRDPDAGLRALTHYERRLPRWRYKLRQYLIPAVRWETPYLAKMQQVCRSPLMDTYFALTANLGTHTFFTVFIPVCIWGRHPDFGLALSHVMTLGVYLSGALKDLVCLPRPLSPPLQRITMSGSAALEYGFPSTHTTNAVSIAGLLLYELMTTKDEWSYTNYILLCIGCYWYASSIALGRMYCGMHGFFDVGIGLLLGVAIAWLWIVFGPDYINWVMSGDWQRPAIMTLICALAIRFHPEPADNCPCFDDSVAMLGVVAGCAIATWHRRHEFAASSERIPTLAEMYDFSNADLAKAGARLIGGVITVFVFRAITKPLLLKSLPPTFRFIDHWGLMIPRRYFLQARYFSRVFRM
jgi:dihydrosphingosine 1-phosphate phosphatase